jgi:hypothetical protein
MRDKRRSCKRYRAVDMSSMQRNIATYPLLRLPREIGNQIYEILYQDATLNVARIINQDIWSNISVCYVNLLRICQQIHADTKHLTWALGTISYQQLSTRYEVDEDAAEVTWVEAREHLVGDGDSDRHTIAQTWVEPGWEAMVEVVAIHRPYKCKRMGHGSIKLL